MTLSLVELIPRVEDLSKLSLDYVKNLSDTSTVHTINLSLRTDANLNITFADRPKEVITSCDTVRYLMLYLNQSFQLSNIKTITLYIFSGKYVIFFDEYRLYIDPNKAYAELQNFSRSKVRNVRQTALTLQLDLLNILIGPMTDYLQKANHRILSKDVEHTTISLDSMSNYNPIMDNPATLNRIMSTYTHPFHNDYSNIEALINASRSMIDLGVSSTLIGNNTPQSWLFQTVDTTSR